MSRMGYAPWEDDVAGDWYDWFLASTELPERLRESLDVKVTRTNCGGVRAAATMLIFLARGLMWPDDTYEADIKLAIEKLNKCHELEQDTTVKSTIQKEIDVLSLMARDALLSEQEPKMLDLWRAWLKL